MIGIIDYGMGNLFSVSKALERLDTNYFISDQEEELLQADGLILPGVGSFKDAMKRLNETGLTTSVKKYVASEKPLLGICLGMQLLFSESEENGLTTGLSLLPGRVLRFSGKTKEGTLYKVPHMGWNRMDFIRRSPLLKGVEEGYAYFVHSYAVHPQEQADVIAKAYYEQDVPAIVGRKNVFGTQFHPEKSSTLGMKLLRNFVEIAGERKTSA
ncbi:imidazole glycerol phosphate synthase subunit HisH [Bacillaceae bacterium Marseille-Q3522]|nr:imidazole glycerol phosphate synthase subunit HisH [Bacillaceae bacterium Marseille-Q3522]